MNSILSKLDYNRGINLDVKKVSNKSFQIIKLEKSFFKDKVMDQYFIKLYKVENDSLVCQGYIYFYLDTDARISTYIGSYVKPEYRSTGIASLLTSYWIKFCLDNGFYDLTTIKSQKKPFLLYILKNYSFEIEDPLKYLKNDYNIHICTLPNDSTKYLVFDNERYAISFKEGTVYKNDNYQIVSKDTENLTRLDTILLSNKHDLQDPNGAFDKSEKRIERFKSI